MTGTDRKRIAIVANETQRSQEVAQLLTEKLSDDAVFEMDAVKPDIILTVGGDGTLLKAFHQYEAMLDTVRFIGVHTGHLGFYTDFVVDEIPEMLSALKDENPATAWKYPLLKVIVRLKNGVVETHHALNEATVRRHSRTLVANVTIADEFFEKFRGDGLSVATPTGSTAYNKSIGGAVMHPRVEALQLTEIASLNNRVFRTLGSPMIVAKKDIIKIFPEPADNYSLSVDQLEFDYEDIESLDYSLDGTTIAFANIAHTHFWERVRNSFITDGLTDN